MSAKSEHLEQESEGERAFSSDELCASCGVAAIDDVKLRDCDGGCDLVKYCSDGCQENHRPQHEDECNKRKYERQKRLAEIRDDIQRRTAELHQTFLSDELQDKELFTQPDGSHLGECPICCLPLPIDISKFDLMSCCCKSICRGCNFANQKREIEGGLEHRCAFCREPLTESQEEYNKGIMNRIKKNDPVAMVHMGRRHYCEGDHGKALEYWIKAADLGDADAHRCLGSMYRKGEGVEKDMKKAMYHLEQAAIGGHPYARYHLGLHEKTNGRFKRAARHFIIAANLGDDVSLKCIKDLFAQGIVTKDDYASSLREYQAAVDATKSVEREKGEAVYALLDQS